MSAEDHVFDVVVVGAGVAGSAAAYMLARSNRCSGGGVCLLERFAFGHRLGSSHGESRIIRRTYSKDHYTAMMARAYTLWDEVEKESGEQLLTTTGSLDIADEQNEALQTLIACARRHNVPIEVLQPAEVKKRFPTINLPPEKVGVYQKDAGSLNASRCVAALQRLARQNGAVLRENAEVVDVQPQELPGGGGLGVRAEIKGGQHVLARKVILTLGPWAKELVSKISRNALSLALDPTKTTVAYWKVDPELESHYQAGNFPTVINYDAGTYGLPCREYPGLFKLCNHHGPWLENLGPGRDFTPDLEGLKPVKEVLAMYEGVDRTAPVLVDVCAYTMTSDADFVYDQLPVQNFGWPEALRGSVILGSPCSGHGFKLGTVSGEILADLALDGKCERHAMEHFRLDRPGVVVHSNTTDAQVAAAKDLLVSPPAKGLIASAASAEEGLPVLLVSDVDGTMLGNAEGLLRFNRLWEKMPKGSKLCFNTSRPIEGFVKMKKNAKDNPILVPDFLICSAGTAVYSFPQNLSPEDPNWVPVKSQEYEDALIGGFDINQVKEVALATAHEVFGAAPTLAPEPDPNTGSRRQTLRKIPQFVSYAGIPDDPNLAREQGAFLNYRLFVRTSDTGNDGPKLAAALSRNCEAKGLKVHIDQMFMQLADDADLQNRPMGSSNDDMAIVDITPANAGKGAGTRWLRRSLGFPEERTLVAGDGGNDMPMFFETQGQERGVAVGNAEDQLKQALKNSHHPHHFQAQGQAAEGVIEGLIHFGLVPQAAIPPQQAKL